MGLLPGARGFSKPTMPKRGVSIPLTEQGWRQVPHPYRSDFRSESKPTRAERGRAKCGAMQRVDV